MKYKLANLVSTKQNECNLHLYNKSYSFPIKQLVPFFQSTSKPH